MKQNYNFWRQTRVRAKKISTAIVILLVFAATVQAQSVKDSAKEETKGNKVEIATPSAHIEGDHMKFDQSIKYPKAGLVYDFTTDIDMQNKTVSMAAKYNFWILEHTDIAKMAWNGQNISYTDETVWGNKAVAAIVFTGYVGDEYEYYDYFDVQLWTLNKKRKSYAAVSIKPLATRRMSLNIEQLLREGASADKIKDEVAKAVDGRVDNDGYWDQIYTTVHPLIGEPYCDNSFSFHRGNGVFSNNERNEIIKILNGLITEGNALKAAGYTLVGEFPGGDFNIEVEPGMPEPDWLDFLALIRDNYVPAAGYTGFWDSYYEDSCNDKGDGDYNDGKSVGEFGSEYIDPKKEKNWKNDEHYTPGITIIPDKARPSLGEKVDVSITVTINHGSSDVVKIENFNWGDGNGLGWFYIYVNNGVGVKTISHTYTKKGSYTISARGWWYPEGDQVSADASFDIYVKDPVNDDGRTILLDDPITNLKTVTLYGNCVLHSAEDAQAPIIYRTGGHRIACIHNTTLSEDKYDVRIPASAYPNEYAYIFGEFSDINNYTALKVKNDIFYETAGMDYTHCMDAGWVFEKNNWAGYARITTNPTIKAYTKYGATADISRTLTGEGILSFYMKWDIMAGGRVTFYIDDEAKFSEEWPDHNWKYYRFILPPGNHTIKWHTEASTYSSGYYAIAELDNIKFVPGTPAEKEFLYDEVESLDGWNIHTYGNSDHTPYLDNSWSTVGDYSCCFTSDWRWADYYGTIDKDVDLTYVRKIKVDLKGDDGKLKIYINGNTVGDIYANGAATYTYDVSNYSGICNLKFAGVPYGNQYTYMYLDNIVFVKQIFEPANPVPFDYSLVTCKNGTETTLASGTVNIPPEQVMGQDMYYFGIEKNGNNYTGYINNVEAGTGSTSNDFNNRIGIGAYSASNVSCVNFDGLKVYSPAPTNIAPLWNGGTITASGGFNSDYTDPATCVDENTETYIYYRTDNSPEYITRDYGKPVYIEKIRLQADPGITTYFYLEVSNDGTNWIQKGECDGDDCRVLANSPWMSVNGDYRYVRIKETGVACCTWNWWAMREIEIIGIVDGGGGVAITAPPVSNPHPSYITDDEYSVKAYADNADFVKFYVNDVLFCTDGSAGNPYIGKLYLPDYVHNTGTTPSPVEIKAVAYRDGNVVATDNINVEIWRYGDVDGGGNISMVDAALVRNHWAYGYDLIAPNSVADVNGDGDISMGDAVLVRNHWAYGYDLTAGKYYIEVDGGSGGKGAEATGGEETVTDIPLVEEPEAGTLLVYPNPMSNELTIEYNMQQAGMVTVDIYDITGRLVQTVTSGYKLPGEHTVQWNANDTNGTEMPNGTYFIRVQSNSNIQTTKVVLMR